MRSYHPAKFAKIWISVEKFKFSKILLGDKIATYLCSKIIYTLIMNSLSLMISQLWSMKTTTIRICVNTNTTRSNLCCNHQTIQENIPTVIHVIFRVRLSRGIFNSLSRMNLFTSGMVAWSFCLIN